MALVEPTRGKRTK